MPHLNYIAVLVTGVVIFILGGLWYSPALFAKPWMRLLGKTQEEMRARQSVPTGLMFLSAFVSGLLLAFVLADVLAHYFRMSPLRGAEVGAMCWLGFTGATMFTNSMFSQKPVKLWAIDAGYYLVCFVVAGLILGAWR